MTKKIVVLGASAAGIAVINTLTNLKADVAITCISREKELPYNKCFLADYVTGTRSADELHILKKEYSNVHFMLGVSVASIDTAKQAVLLEDGRSIAYDALFLGLGSSVIWPSLPKNARELQGIFAFHTLADILAIQEYAQKTRAKHAVVVGAGLSGLECADALHAQGFKVTLIERNTQILGGQLTPEAGGFLANRIAKTGVTLHLGAEISEIHSHPEPVEGSGKIAEVVVQGNNILTNLLIYATGLKANTAILPPEIQVSQGAVVVNEHMQTSVPGVYAGGDLILVKDTITGLVTRSCTWPDAIQQGVCAAHHMLGLPKVYPGVALIVSSAFFGLKYAATLTSPGIPSKVVQGVDFYHTFYLNSQGILQGFSLLGNTKNMPLFKRLCLTREPVSWQELLYP